MMTKKLLSVLILTLAVITSLIIVSQYVFGGADDCQCDYAYIYDKYEYICPTGFAVDDIISLTGYCSFTTCVKEYKIICIGDQIAFDMFDARIVNTYEWIPNCCDMDVFE